VGLVSGATGESITADELLTCELLIWLTSDRERLLFARARAMRSLYAVERVEASAGVSVGSMTGV